MRYHNLISKMSLEEKASLLSGATKFSTKGITRLGIPPMNLSDGPHGLRKHVKVADNLGINKSLPATCFPTASAVANTWDIQLVEQLGSVLGEEAVSQGINMVLGPGLNMKRSPLCGRNFEYFSEDPVLAGKLAAAYIRGIQSHGIAACAKHFAANNQETYRMHSDSIVDERTFREIYLTGFEIAIKEGGPLAIMSAYNRINGTYASEDKKLLRDILVDTWGYKGIVITDWGASNDWAQSLVAGNHLEMPATNGNTDREIISDVRSGQLPEAILDERVDEYLQVLFATRLKEKTQEFDVDAHHAFARKVAREATVLLKNEGHLLPLTAGQKVAVIGDFAETPRYQGAGSSLVNPTRRDSPLECLRTTELDIVGYAPGFIRAGGDDPGKRDEAVALAQQADVVVFFIGLDEISESEGFDRKHMQIHSNQVDVLKALSAVNPNIVAVLVGGAPIETPWAEHCKAMIHGYLGGQAYGSAIADVLTGKVNPSGKLAETWPVVYEDTPTSKYFPGLEKTAEYREGPFIGYRYYQKAKVPVRFPFGFGLSYTDFQYSDLSVSAQEVSFTLSNTGAAAGAEVAQVYIGIADSRLFRADIELKGFTKVFLEPGESRIVTVPLDDKAFRYFNITTGKYEIERGTYSVYVGSSSANLLLRGFIEQVGTDAPAPYDPHDLPSYYSANVTDVCDREFQSLLGHPIPPAKWDRTGLLDINDTISQLFYAKSFLARRKHKYLIAQLAQAAQSGKPNLSLLFDYNMTFRDLAKTRNGSVDMHMVFAYMEIINGHFWRGGYHLIVAKHRMKKGAKETARLLADTTK